MKTAFLFAISAQFIIVSCAGPVITGDKWAHGVASVCITSAGIWLAQEAGADDFTAVVCGAGLSAYLGVLKEYSDSRAGRRFDGGDLIADLVGTVTAASVYSLLMED